MSFLKATLKSAGNNSASLLRRAARGPGGRTYGGNVDPLGLNTTDMSQAGEQLSHNRGYVYAVVRTIANRIAGQPVHMAEVDGDTYQRNSGIHLKSVPPCLRGQVAGGRPVTNHPLLTALADPNPVMLPWSLMFFTISSLELTGRGFWWLLKDEECGKWQIWPLPAQWMSAIHADRLYSGWKVNPGGYGNSFTLSPDEVVYYYYPDPSNPVGALSPLQAAATSVFADEAISESQRRMFLNGCNPGLALTVGRLPDNAGVSQTGQRPVLTKEQRDALIASVKRHYRGVQANEEPLLLDGMIEDVKKITTTAREMDFLNSGEVTKGRISQTWGVNPISMGEMSSTRAESAVADEHLIANVIKPRVEMFSQALTTWVVPRFTPDEKFVAWVELPVATDLDYELELHKSMIDRGALSRNEWRGFHGLPPIAGGDTAITSDGQNSPGGGPTIPVRPIQQNMYGGLVTRAPIQWSKENRREMVRTFRKAARRQRDARAAAMAVALRTVLASMKDAIIQHADTTVRGGAPYTESMVDHAIHDSEWLDVIKGAMRPHIEAAGFAGAELEWQRHHAVYAGKGAPNQPRRLMEQVLRGVKRLLNGESWRNLIDSVRSVVKNSLRKLADVIGWQEASRQAVSTVAEALDDPAADAIAYQAALPEARAAGEAGAHEVRKFNHGNGVQMNRRWKCQSDNRVRPAHRSADGQTVGMVDKFHVGGRLCDYPGDPDLPPELRCNCRCYTETVYVRPKALDGLGPIGAEKPLIGPLPANGGFNRPPPVMAKKGGE